MSDSAAHQSPAAMPVVADAAPSAFALSGSSPSPIYDANMSPNDSEHDNATDSDGPTGGDEGKSGAASVTASPKRPRIEGKSECRTRPDRKINITKLHFDEVVNPLLLKLAAEIGVERVDQLKKEITDGLGVGEIFGSSQRDSVNKLNNWKPTRPILLEYGLKIFALHLNDPNTGSPYAISYGGQFKYLASFGSEWAVKYGGLCKDATLLATDELPPETRDALLKGTQTKETIDVVKTYIHTQIQYANKYIRYRALEYAAESGEDKERMKIVLHMSSNLLCGDPSSKGLGIVCTAASRPYVQRALNDVYESCQRQRLAKKRATEADA